MPAFKDLTGQVFGRLLVLEQAERNRHNQTQWLVECACVAKTRKVVGSCDLAAGKTVSCGCWRDELATARLNAIHPNQKGEHHPSFLHGHDTRSGDSPTYRTWRGMRDRCMNPNADHFTCYGGAGIKVCDRWLTSFEAFLTDMGERPEGTSLGRFGDIGNYEPENCAWQTKKEQVAEQKMKRQLQFIAA